MASRVVIAGCGFGGLEVAYNLKRMLKDRIELTAIDKEERFTYLPSLPEIVTGKTTEKDITLPYAKLFGRIGARFAKARISGIDLRGKAVLTDRGRMGYDYLIISLGSEAAYYGIKGAKENTFAFKSIEDAEALREHLVRTFSSMEGVEGEMIDDTVLRVTVVGGGLTGVELITEMRTFVDEMCRRHGLPRERCELILVDHGSILHPSFNEEVGEYTEQYFKKNDIKLIHGRAVTEVQSNKVMLDDGTVINSRTIVWCAGIRPEAVVSSFEAGLLDKKHGLVLNSYLQLMGDPTVFSIGDCSYSKIFEAAPILTAVRATEQAEFVSENLYYEITGQHDRKVVYMPRSFPTLIGLCRGMGVLVFEGFWMKGRAVWAMKKATQYLYMWRYRYNLSFLEYLDEFAISMIELMYFVRMRRP